MLTAAYYIDANDTVYAGLPVDLVIRAGSNPIPFDIAVRNTWVFFPVDSTAVQAAGGQPFYYEWGGPLTDVQQADSIVRWLQAGRIPPALPAGCELKLFPNPSNGRANIGFRLENETKVRLEIFNLLGQKVASLWDGKAQPGNTMINYDASLLASGAYVVRLEVGSGVEGKVMLIEK